MHRLTHSPPVEHDDQEPPEPSFYTLTEPELRAYRLYHSSQLTVPGVAKLTGLGIEKTRQLIRSAAAKLRCEREDKDRIMTETSTNGEHANGWKDWTPAEDERLSELRRSHTQKQCAALLGRSAGAVAYRCSFLDRVAKGDGPVTSLPAPDPIAVETRHGPAKVRPAPVRPSPVPPPAVPALTPRPPERSRDPEIETLAEIVARLLTLSPAARGRAARWLADRFLDGGAEE